jgi:hypothetical protein
MPNIKKKIRARRNERFSTAFAFYVVVVITGLKKRDVVVEPITYQSPY